jgi:hypothetical protein
MDIQMQLLFGRDSERKRIEANKHEVVVVIERDWAGIFSPLAKSDQWHIS